MNKQSQQFVEKLVKVIKARPNDGEEIAKKIASAENQAKFYEDIENQKSFTATGQSGSGNTPATGSGFLQTNLAPIQVFSQPSDLLGAIKARGYEFGPIGNVISGNAGLGFNVNMPVMSFTGGSMYKSIDQAILDSSGNLVEPNVTKGLATYEIIPHRYALNLPYITLQGISTSHSLTNLYNIYQKQDLVQRQKKLSEILVDTLMPIGTLGNTNIANITFSTETDFPMIATVYDLTRTLYNDGAERVAVLMNYKACQRLQTELTRSGVRVSNFGQGQTGETINGQAFSINQGNGTYFGTIGGVDVFRARQIEDTLTDSSGAITARTGGSQSAVFAFDPLAIANHEGSQEYNMFVIEEDKLRTIINGGVKLGALYHAGGVAIQGTRVVYSTFTA